MLPHQTADNGSLNITRSGKQGRIQRGGGGRESSGEGSPPLWGPPNFIKMEKKRCACVHEWPTF